ncbi:MAG: HEAT repeat domain-containing protein, partial [Candidatus Omnitrophica bacterium]|nr:HEAT repeat domain-containing protein [Candidatus Omnitrophota bacterium]
MRRMIRGILSLLLAFLGAGISFAENPIQLEPTTEEKCLDILRTALDSEEFWPSMHAAEAMTLAGHGEEIREDLESRLESEKDDQHRCGLARELVRSGDRSMVAVLIDVLNSEDPYGHVHACESLYKVNEIGDGEAIRR